MAFESNVEVLAENDKLNKRLTKFKVLAIKTTREQIQRVEGETAPK